ncbi:MAG: hypothetical protein ACYCQJ_03510 [Nitrososphaerales archaeon]
MSSPEVKPGPTTQAQPAPAPAPAQPVAKTQLTQEGPILFHFGECTNCHHLLPISTTTEKYFALLSKDPKKPAGLGEKCARCGADSWILIVG